VKFFSKMIFLLFFLFFYLPLSAIAATATIDVNEKPAKSSRSVPSKKARLPAVAGSTVASLPVRLTWQIIHSQGEGTKLATSAETFSQAGEIVPVGVDVWRLRVSGHDIPVSVNLGHKGAEGVVFVERSDLLKALNITLNPEWTSSEGDWPAQNGVALVLSRNKNRYLETIYRAPDENLFLVKAMIFLLQVR
jgi:hypothetical protein